MDAREAAGRMAMCVLQDDLEGAKEIARQVTIIWDDGEPIIVQLEEVLENDDPDDYYECDTCGQRAVLGDDIGNMYCEQHKPHCAPCERGIGHD